MRGCRFIPRTYGLLLGLPLLFAAWPARAQVSPAEIGDAQARALESQHFAQLKALNQAISSAKFPFPLVLSRYVGLDPKQEEGTDRRGIQFVKFHGRMLLEITGNYNAAFSGDVLTANQRASRLVEEVIAPILALSSKEFSAGVACDGVGLEISYHVRSRIHNADYEGKEIVVLVLDKADAFRYAEAADPERQEILNRSEVYLNGKRFGLALGQRDPLALEALDPSEPVEPTPARPAPAPSSVNPILFPRSDARSAGVSSPKEVGTQPDPQARARVMPSTAVPGAVSAPRAESPASEAQPVAGATPTDLDRLQSRYQAQLDALVKAGEAKFHLVSYAPPSFVAFQNRVYLQLTLRNPARFDRAATSIYKRAAQSFDLFLAPLLRDLLAELPSQAEIYGLDITVLDEFSAPAGSSSEAVEYLCPLAALRQFAAAEITNQQLIDQSIVLVNGVRISLNLPQVE